MKLTPRQSEILGYLTQKPEGATRQEIEKHVWPWLRKVGKGVVKAHMWSIRKAMLLADASEEIVYVRETKRFVIWNHRSGEEYPS